MMVSSWRETAYHALLEYSKENVRADHILNNHLSAVTDNRDKKLITTLFYGVIQNLYYLDHSIKSLSSVKMNKISRSVLSLLRMGYYQILFMGSVPASAATNTTVDLAKKHTNQRAASFVNAMLRSLVRNGPPALDCDTESERLSLLYSHPQWLVDELINEIGMEQTEKFLKDNNEPADTIVRENTLKHFDGILNTERFKPIMSLPNCYSLVEGFYHYSDDLRDGLIYVQDAASQIAVQALNPKPGANVIDMCAAPGGKSLLAAQLMNDTGKILSIDITEIKTESIKKNAARLGVKSIQTRTHDSRVFLEELKEWAEYIICDVPCSGFGVIRKKPDVRYKTKESISELPQIQFDILSNASRYLKKDGILLYSTCTVLRKENYSVIERFLNENPGFGLLPWACGPINCKEGCITLWPQIHGTDGFFIALLRRTA